jgi:RND family efflux transporter MFP subunit
LYRRKGGCEKHSRLASKRLMQKTVLSSIALLTLILTCGTVFAQAAIPVQVSRLDQVLVDLQWRAPAEVVTLNNATLSAEVAAVVRAVYADVGHAAEKGDLLVELDCSDYQLNLQQAQANLVSSRARKAQADARLKRARELIQNQYMSQDELLATETEVMVTDAEIRSNEVSVAIARRSIDKCKVIAPFNGVVNQRSAQTGSYVTVGSPLLGFTETDRFELDADIPAALASSVALAHSIYFESRNEQWPLDLLRLSPVIDSALRARTARFRFAGEAPAVGRSGEVVWIVENGLLPASLVVRRNGILGVFLNLDGVATFTALPGAQEGRPVPVELPPDTEIVVQGRDRLQHGDRIIPNG